MDMPRPCPFVSCKHHLLLEVSSSGALVLNAGQTARTLPRRVRSERRVEPFTDHAAELLVEATDTCSLDVADRTRANPGDETLRSIGQSLRLTRERIRQIEIDGEEKLRPILRAHGLGPEEDDQ